MPYFNLNVPVKETVDEDSLYADEIILDCGGADIYVAGEYEMSLSWDGLDRVDVALAVLEGEYKVADIEIQDILDLESGDSDELAAIGYMYLKASQKRGNC